MLSIYFCYSTDTDGSSVKRQHEQYSFLKSPEVSDSESEEAMFKRPRFLSSGSSIGTQPFHINIDSDESSVESDANIMNAQSCKFGRVEIEMSEGNTGNISISSAQAQLTTRSTPTATPTASVQPPITKHFTTKPKVNSDVHKQKPEDNTQLSASDPQAAGPSIGGAYSLVRSGVALSNL